MTLEKGKPRESVGRKATGLSLKLKGYGSRAAGRMQHLLEAVLRTAKEGREVLRSHLLIF